MEDLFLIYYRYAVGLRCICNVVFLKLGSEYMNVIFFILLTVYVGLKYFLIKITKINKRKGENRSNIWKLFKENKVLVCRSRGPEKGKAQGFHGRRPFLHLGKAA